MFPRVIIQEDVEHAARALQRELALYDVESDTSESDGKTLMIARTLRESIFAIDINMGPGRAKEGMHTIQGLREMRGDQHDFFIVALTSHRNYEAEAVQRGADAFLDKGPVRLDAIKLLKLYEAHKLERAQAQGERLHVAFMEEEYPRVVEMLSRLQGQSNAGNAIKTAYEAIRGILAMPFLRPVEQLVLSAIEEEMSAAQNDGVIDAALAAHLQQGMSLIAGSAAADSDVHTWLRELVDKSGNNLLSWSRDYEDDDGQ